MTGQKGGGKTHSYKRSGKLSRKIAITRGQIATRDLPPAESELRFDLYQFWNTTKGINSERFLPAGETHLND